MTSTENKGAVSKEAAGAKDGGPRDAKEKPPRSSVKERMEKDPIRNAVRNDDATILATEAVSTASKDPGNPTTAELAERAMQRRAERAEEQPAKGTKSKDDDESDKANEDKKDARR